MISCILLLLGLGLTADGKAISGPDNFDAKYGLLVDLPTKELVERGREYLYGKNQPDSALICFSIATSRYHKSLSEEDKRAIYQAYTGKWYAQFFHYYNFPQAYGSLIEARKISEELGKGNGMADFNLSLMYQMFGTDGRDTTALNHARVFREKSFQEAIQERDSNVVHMAFSNMVSSSEGPADLERLKEFEEQYKVFNKGSRHPVVVFNTLQYDIKRAIAAKEYGRALELLAHQREYILPGQPRYIISNLMTRADACLSNKNAAEAESLLDEAERISVEFGMKDVLLNIYDAKKQLYHATGDTHKEGEAYYEYLCMKDTLLNYRQISGFSELGFLSEIERLDHAMAKIEYKRRTQVWIVVGCVTAIVVLLSFLILIIRKNRKLRAANMSLYEGAKERMKLEDELSSTETAAPSMDESQRELIIQAAVRVASTSEEIYSSKFTIAKFSELLGLPVKKVSQAINESEGENFNGFINRFRIRRACRMLDDIDTYGNLTIENIGMSVGFRSRTAFIGAFKKQTGLNPSDYLKAARHARLSHAACRGKEPEE